MKAAGLAAFRADLSRLEPFLADRVQEIKDWEQVKLLTVAVSRLKTWHQPGLLCLGDAAHAMSPIGGVGVNLAIQDAVAAANILIPRFRAGSITDKDLSAIEQRRTFPAKATQRLQIIIQNQLIGRILASDAPLKLPLFLRALKAIPLLRRLPAYIVGIGIRPEHIDHPAYLHQQHS